MGYVLWYFRRLRILAIDGGTDSRSKPSRGRRVQASRRRDHLCGAADFFYPITGAKNIRLYETKNIEVDNSDYSNYNQVFLESEPVFNGYLRRFSQKSPVEKWIIVTFEL